MTSPWAEHGQVGTRLVAAAGLAALLIGSGLAVALALDGDDDGALDAARATSSTPSAVKPAAVVVVRVPLSAVGALDPEGDQRENDAEAVLAVDGDVATSWRTERYESFFKEGVGLVLDAGAVRRLQRLDVVSATPGVTAEIRAGTSREGPFRTIARERALSEVTRFPLGGARGRYVVVWITGLPGGGEAEVAEARLRVRR